ncbi:hypothetical protein THC_0169 [Caldimicrobium thiodismutans]|uniref:TonB C-terminal domain-containing protein n=1 Tax=Caldimicrobium thiodismutans TaxID=1653476 RepID=A0A0U5AXV6_9BACT|nr:TonB C-terminal domain-containing protein [Caldimicrobium thiodismutans]BAU22569.1 hypothetical protein THC_0169 [Caldimicrobium thiodismutans]
MALNLSAVFLSLFINIFLSFLLLTGLSFSVKKKEEVKITLLESPSFLSQSEVKPQALPPISSPRETPPLPSSSKVQEKPPKEASKLQVKKSTPESKPSEESLLKERLSQLKAKENQISHQEKDEMEFLQNKLASLKNRIKEKGPLKEGIQERPFTPTTTSSASPLSQDYLLLVKRKLQTHFEVPIYLKNKKGLSALVEIEVSNSGEITKINFIQRSPEPAFNRAIERCLSAVSPLPVNQKTSLKIEFRAEGIFKIN